MFKVECDKFAEITIDKFKVIWPSARSTPPTEANISTIFTEIYSDNYFCFTEVPIAEGRIDMILVDRAQKEIVYCEFKSSKHNSVNEISSDIERLDKLSINSMSYYVGNPPPEAWKVIFQWSENESEVDYNIVSLSEKYSEMTFNKRTIECEDATLYCLFSAWQ